MSQSLALKTCPQQTHLDYQQPVHGGPTDLNTRRSTDVEKKKTPGNTKQPPQWTKMYVQNDLQKTSLGSHFAQWKRSEVRFSKTLVNAMIQVRCYLRF